jgi:hypothetical protein
MGPSDMLKRVRTWLAEARRRQAAHARAIDLALAEFRRTRDVAPMGAHVLRLGEDEAIVRVMYVTTHVPPDRAWFSVSVSGVRSLSYDEVAHLETPWR